VARSFRFMESMSEHTQTILVVDDEASQRELLGGFAATLGHVVREACSGEEALDAIRWRP